MLFTLTGSVRGNCWHKHTTMMGAARCSVADQKDCESQGGYSDRSLVVIDESESRKPTADEYAEFCDCIDRVKNG